jgi:biofilm PGA synthesis N-glycosyltransferase PgaC
LNCPGDVAGLPAERFSKSPSQSPDREHGYQAMNPLSPEKQIRYVVITPARDEAQHIAETILSVAEQTIRPLEWVIVNDGSTDGTGDILERCAAEYSWIAVLHRPDRGVRKNGMGVIEAFACGYQSLRTAEWDFIAKLDGDVCLNSDYFESCFREFQKDPSLGVGGGLICHLENGVLKVEDCPRFHVRGATKIYSRACWDAIGGLLKAPGWDTVDEVKANMLGWKTRTFRHLKVLHRRRTGAADGAWRNSVKDGRADYTSGYHPLFMFLKCVKRLVRRPMVVGSLGLLYGFISAYLKRTPQVNDRALIHYVRRQQLRRLLFLNSIWK